MGGGDAMADLDLAYTPAVELVRLIRERSLSPVELMENCLARIEELNPRLNCFCFVFASDGLDAGHPRPGAP